MRDKMKKEKKTKLNYKRAIIVIITLVVVILALLLAFQFLTGNKKNKQNPVKVVDSLEKYGYTLEENETSYYKGLFQSLKEELKKDDIDEENYAKLIVQLFCADFFNLDNKLSKNDIGGTEFVYESYRSDFEKYARESIYHYVESNLYGERKQELPVVKEVTIISIEQKSHDYLEMTDKEAYVVDAEITYQKDLGYQQTATFYLVHQDHKLEIVEMEH